MNNWKIAFWCCFTLLALAVVVSLYSIVNQGVTLTYRKEGYTDTENDLDQIIEIINETDLTKPQIEVELKDHKLYESMDFKSDTVSLYRCLLIFDNNRLKAVSRQL